MFGCRNQVCNKPNPDLVRQGSAYLKGGHSCSLVCCFSKAAIKFVINPYLVRQDSAHLKGGHSCSLVLRAHVLLEHSQGYPMRPQVATDELDVHPELAEDNGLGQSLALLLGRLRHSMQGFTLTLACRASH